MALVVVGCTKVSRVVTGCQREYSAAFQFTLNSLSLRHSIFFLLGIFVCLFWLFWWFFCKSKIHSLVFCLRSNMASGFTIEHRFLSSVFPVSSFNRVSNQVLLGVEKSLLKQKTAPQKRQMLKRMGRLKLVKSHAHST